VRRGAGVTPKSVLAAPVIDLAGVATRLWAADLARAEAVAAMLRAAPPASGPPSAELRFEHGVAAPDDWSDDDPFEVRREGTDLVYVRSALGLVARVTPNRIVVVGDAPDLRAAFRPVFALAVAHLLAARERHVLHAATLAVEDGCVLVLGPTGAGKSTAAVCALRAGWPVLGDDLVALESLGDRIVATAVPRPIVAPRDVVDDPRAVPVSGDGRQRLELGPDVITPGRSPVLGLIVSAHGDAPASTVREVRHSAIPPLVLTSCLLADSADSRRSLFPLAMALSRLPTVELAHGTRSATRVEDGAALLEEIRRLLGNGSL